jgi:hypothetical protein
LFSCFFSLNLKASLFNVIFVLFSLNIYPFCCFTVVVEFYFAFCSTPFYSGMYFFWKIRIVIKLCYCFFFDCIEKLKNGTNFKTWYLIEAHSKALKIWNFQTSPALNCFSFSFQLKCVSLVLLWNDRKKLTKFSLANYKIIKFLFSTCEFQIHMYQPTWSSIPFKNK